MHAGGVAENNGPWNDEKDPFEVKTKTWTYFLQFTCSYKSFHLLTRLEINFLFLQVSLKLKNENWWKKQLHMRLTHHDGVSPNLHTSKSVFPSFLPEIRLKILVFGHFRIKAKKYTWMGLAHDRLGYGNYMSMCYFSEVQKI